MIGPRGRLYLPREVLALHGAEEADLAAGRLTPAWVAALQNLRPHDRRTVPDRSRCLATV